MCLNHYLLKIFVVSTGYDSIPTTYVSIKIRVQNQQRANKKFLEQEKYFGSKKDISKSGKKVLVIEIRKLHCNKKLKKLQATKT